MKKLCLFTIMLACTSTYTYKPHTRDFKVAQLSRGTLTRSKSHLTSDQFQALRQKKETSSCKFCTKTSCNLAAVLITTTLIGCMMPTTEAKLTYDRDCYFSCVSNGEKPFNCAAQCAK